MTRLIAQFIVQGISLWVLQISNYHITIVVARDDHGVVGVEADPCVRQEWLLVDSVELLRQHVDDDQVPAEEPLQAALGGHEGQPRTVSRAEGRRQDLGGVRLRGYLRQERVLLGDDAAISGLRQHEVLVLLAHRRADNLV